MGFLLLAESAGPAVQKQEDAVFHRMGCKVCPLNQYPGRMEPTGAAHPLVYCLGEAPGVTEIEQGKQFVGESGQILRDAIPREYRDKIRWNNVVRSHPPKNRNPEHIEIESCRPSIISDIEQSKPKAIFGFGNVPLRWVSGFSNVTLWRGRKMPVQVGKHTCWYYPMLHPAYLLYPHYLMEEDERMFQLDLDRAFAEVPNLSVPEVHTPEQAYAGIELVTDPWQLGVLLSDAIYADAVGIDYETKGLRPYAKDAKLLTAAVSTASNSFAFPFNTNTQELWCAFLRQCKGPKVVHNLAFELEWTGVMLGQDLIRAGRWEDTATQAAILDERTGKSKPGCFSLEFLVQNYFGFNLKDLSNLDKANLDREPLADVLRYNAADAKYHLLLWRKLRDEIKKQKLEQAYELALRRVPTVVLTQIKGVPVDQTVVARLRSKYKKRVGVLETEIKAHPTVAKFKRHAGHDFNPGSPDDCKELFYKMLGCKECEVAKKRGKRDEIRISVEIDVLEKIVPREPLARLVIDLRHVIKMYSTYLGPLSPPAPDNPNSTLWPDGLLHARFNTFFAETGRLSIDEPSLQNFPKRNDEAKEVRRPIRAPAEHWILSADYGQIEMRVLAMATKAKGFVNALWKDLDVHMDWAQRLAKAYPQRIGGEQYLDDKKVMKAFRVDIKNQWTFPLVYGCSLSSAAGYLNIPERIVRPHYDLFWDEFAEVKRWQQKQVSFYQKYGYVEDLTGRRRHGPLSKNMIFNTPIQSTATGIAIDAMGRLSETGDPELQAELMIHDDLTLLRVPKKRFDDVVEKLLSIMLDVPFEWAKIVPITVELSVGTDWSKLEDIGTVRSNEWFK